MAVRAVPLSQMVESLRLELRMGNNAGLSTNMRPALVQSLQRAQVELYSAFDWPFLRVDVEVPVLTGQTRYAIPDAIEPSEVSRVFTRDTEQTEWMLVESYFAPSDTAPADDAQGSPVRRWWTEIDPAVNVEQMVVWPTPTVDATLLVRGKRPLLPLVNDADTSTIDATLVVLAAAAEHLADMKSNRAQAVQAKATARFKQLKGNMAGARKRGPLMIGKGVPRRRSMTFANPGFTLDGTLID